MWGNGVEKLHRDKSLFKCPVIKAHAHTEQVPEGIKSVEPTLSLYFKARCDTDLGEVSAGKGLAPQAPPRAHLQSQTARTCYSSAEEGKVGGSLGLPG